MAGVFDQIFKSNRPIGLGLIVSLTIILSRLSRGDRPISVL